MKLSVLALTPAVALSAFAAAVPVDRAVHPATPMSARHSLQARAPPASPNPKALLDLISATLNGNLKREEVADVDNIDEVADLPEEFIELLIFLLSHVKDEDLAGDIVSKRQDLGEVAEAAGDATELTDDDIIELIEQLVQLKELGLGWDDIDTDDLPPWVKHIVDIIEPDYRKRSVLERSPRLFPWMFKHLPGGNGSKRSASASKRSASASKRSVLERLVLERGIDARSFSKSVGSALASFGPLAHLAKPLSQITKPKRDEGSLDDLEISDELLHGILNSITSGFTSTIGDNLVEE